MVSLRGSTPSTFKIQLMGSHTDYTILIISMMLTQDILCMVLYLLYIQDRMVYQQHVVSCGRILQIHLSISLLMINIETSIGLANQGLLSFSSLLASHLNMKPTNNFFSSVRCQCLLFSAWVTINVGGTI
jgi:hypothetical protein